MNFSSQIVALTLLLAGAALADPPLDDEQRKELVDLPRTYRAAEDNEAKQKVLARAVELGPKGVARLRPIVEGAVRRELGKYQPLFQRALSALAVQAGSQLTVEQVLESSEPASQQRSLLLAAIKLADALGPPPDAKGEAAKSFAEQLSGLETGAVQQMKLARSMQTLDVNERSVIEGINQQRKQRGLPPLEVDAALCRACKGHSYDMQQRGFFSHESPVPGKQTFGARAKLAGTRASAENIAKSGSGKSVVTMWMKSDGHRRNILSSTRRIGVGRAGSYFTAMFGR